MRALVIKGMRDAAVVDVEPPVAGPGQAVVEVERVGVCGTDVELFEGTMAYLLDGHESYPVRPGHEWMGTVRQIGPDVDRRWLGARVTGDTMLGCGACERCGRGRHHVCENRYEIGIRGGWPGALAERLLVPASALHLLPDALDAAAGALIEPAGSALRAVEAAAVGPGDRVCVWGPGTLGLFVTQFAALRGAIVDVVGLDADRLALAEELGADTTRFASQPRRWRYDAVIDTSTSPDVPANAIGDVEPSGRVVLVGLANTASTIDSRELIFGDVTVVGILAASAWLARTIELFASGRVRTAPLIGATVSLDDAADVLAGRRPPGAGPGPKIQIDPRQ